MEEMSSFAERKNYYLLNKDVVIARFHVDVRLDTITVDEVLVELPAWYGDLDTFVTNRRAPKHRANMRELLRMSGCDTVQGFLDISHALSLVDTFWVKPVDSRLSWEDVSLYRNPFSETVARTAFEGGLHGQVFSTTSPEYGTDGSFAKCWVREDDTIRMLKRGSSGARNAGLEPFSEFYASQVAERFTDNFVKYGLRKRDGRICSVCDIFTSEQFGFLPFVAVDSGNSTVNSVVRKAAEFGLEEDVKRMFVLDAVIMNEDRHKNNFGFLVENDTQEIVGMAPLFDHNVSLLPYAEEEDFRDGKYVEERGPRIGNNWLPGAAACLTAETRKVLAGLQDFKFERHPKYNLPEWRLEALEYLIHENARKILAW